jgi:hypothetical protein
VEVSSGNGEPINKRVRDEVRSAIEDRATWLYLIMKELSKEGKIEEIPEINKAIFKFGEMKGDRMPTASSPGEWARALISPVGEKVFEQKLIKDDNNEAVIEFSYCPLVTAWRKLDVSAQDIAVLCRIARCGDFGRIAGFPLKLRFEKLLAEGDEVCRLVVSRNV